MNRPDVLPMRTARAMVDVLAGRGRTRDAAMVAVACGFGLRAGDVVTLTWGDLFDEEGKVRERVTITEQKTGNTRVVLVLPFVADALKAWWRETLDHDPRERAFPVTREHFWRIVRDVARDMNLRGRITPHSLRKAFCDAVYQETRDPVLTARVTGHSNPAQLLRYIGRTQETEEAVWRRLATTLGRGGR